MLPAIAVQAPDRILVARMTCMRTYEPWRYRDYSNVRPERHAFHGAAISFQDEVEATLKKRYANGANVAGTGIVLPGLHFTNQQDEYDYGPIEAVTQ